MQTAVFVVFCALFYCAAAATPWAVCEGFTGTIKVINVTIPGCAEAPCKLQKGKNATGIITFQPSVKETDVTNKLYGIIAGVPVPFPLPDGDACKLGVTCPIPAEKTVTEKVTIPVATSYPAITLDARWELLDSRGKEQACFEVPIQIVG